MYSAVVVQEVLQRRWEPWRWEAQWPATGSWQQPTERIIEPDPLPTTWEVAQEFNVNHSTAVWHLKQTGQVKKLNKWVPHELTAIKKIFIRKCCLLLLYATTTNHFSIGCDVRPNGLYTTTSNDQLRGWTKKKLQSTLQSQTFIPKMSWSLFGGLLSGWPTTAFWILAKPSHLRSMLSKSMQCTDNYNACSQHWSTEWAQFFSMTTPDCTSHNQCFKNWENCAVKFCLICHTHLVQLLSHLNCHIHLTSQQLTTTSSSILTTFCRENPSTTNRRQKMLCKSSLNPQAQILCYKNKQA